MHNTKIYGEHDSIYGQVYILLNPEGLLEQCAFSPFDLTGLSFVYDEEQTKPIAQAIGFANTNVKLKWQGTEFQQTVWKTLLTIPYGETRSYQQVANQINRPNAVRAVANALAKNPIAWFVPCHRVIRHNRQLGGYAWGMDLKQQMLEHETSCQSK
jgi:O-6-methylguanine DNA methyltransferase